MLTRQCCQQCVQFADQRKNMQDFLCNLAASQRFKRMLQRRTEWQRVSGVVNSTDTDLESPEPTRRGAYTTPNATATRLRGTHRHQRRRLTRHQRAPPPSGSSALPVVAALPEPCAARDEPIKLFARWPFLRRAATCDHADVRPRHSRACSRAASS